MNFSTLTVIYTGPRESVVDFTLPYNFDALVLLTAALKEKSRLLAVFSPVNPQVT